MKDKIIKKIIEKEKARQKRVINLIASENYVSKDVLEALGSEFTNKYAEGYSKNRYYGGNVVVDELDDLTRARALKLFKLSPKNWSVNIQALSGSPANLAVLSALVPLGEKIMGMDLSSGGHLTHGSKVSLTGKLWKSVSYGLDPKTEKLNYAEILEIAKREMPKLIIAGFTAYSRKIDWKEFRKISDAVGAILMVDMSHLSGLVAGGAYPSPFPYADVVTTTTHKTLRGPRSALIFSKNEFAPKIDKAVFPGLQGGPHMNQIAAASVALSEAQTSEFKNYAKQVVKNAKAFADEFKKLGFKIISGGTDSHLFLIDTIKSVGLSGGAVSLMLEKEGIIVNKNTVPFDERKPSDPSGIRVGTPAETTRGKKEEDFRKIARKINSIIRNK